MQETTFDMWSRIKGFFKKHLPVDLTVFTMSNSKEYDEGRIRIWDQGDTTVMIWDKSELRQYYEGGLRHLKDEEKYVCKPKRMKAFIPSVSIIKNDKDEVVPVMTFSIQDADDDKIERYIFPPNDQHVFYNALRIIYTYMSMDEKYEYLLQDFGFKEKNKF